MHRRSVRNPMADQGDHHPSTKRKAAVSRAGSVRSNDPRSIGAEQMLGLQRTVGNRATRNLVSRHASHDSLQRLTLWPAHDYGNGMSEPEVRTSVNFDTNHLVNGDVTTDIAGRRFATRSVPKNTVVSAAALKREVEKNDRDLIDRTNTAAVTKYQFTKPTEAMQATGPASAIFSGEIGLNSRIPAAEPNVVEIHHLHEAAIAMHADDFPALGAKKKT